MDFLIKNTKGLTLKTKGKYCTEDLVIEIDPSLVEGYMEVDELPEVGLPRVLYKLMLEEPEYYIWENDEWVKISGSDPNLQEKTVTPSNSSQTITPDTDYDGLIKVNVEAIPDEYIIPNLQEKEITGNGDYVADEGYDGFSKVTVNVASSGGGGLIEVTELPEVGEENTVYKLVSKSGTVVPNSGYVNKVYFNKNMSNEEIISLCEKYCSIPIDKFGKMLIYPIVVDVTNYKLINLVKHILDDGNFLYQLAMFKFNASSGEFGQDDTTPTVWVYNDINEDLQGFKLENDYLELNWTTYYDFNGVPIGNNNDKIANLVSSTPFEAKEEYYIYGDSEPTQVPNSGMVDKIYFNTDLSIEEVVSILENAQVNGGTNAIINYNGNDLTFIKVTNNSIPTWYIGNFSTLDIYFASNTTGGYADFEGWKSNFNGVLEINGEVTQGDVDNSKLVDLVSITPFGSGWIKISGNEIDLTKYPSYPYTFGSVYKYADDTATIFIKQNKDNVEMIQKTSSYFVYSKIYANVKFTNLLGTDLVKYTNDDRRLFISEFNTFFGITIGTLEENYYQLIFNLDGSKMKMLAPSGDTTTPYELSLQADTTEWDALISENNIPEITEDTEV